MKRVRSIGFTIVLFISTMLLNAGILRGIFSSVGLIQPLKFKVGFFCFGAVAICSGLCLVKWCRSVSSLSSRKAILRVVRVLLLSSGVLVHVSLLCDSLLGSYLPLPLTMLRIELWALNIVAASIGGLIGSNYENFFAKLYAIIATVHSSRSSDLARLSRHMAFLILGLILCSIFILRIPSLATPIWSMDEAVSATVANTILCGGVPYQDAVDHRGPVTYYVYAFIFFLFGRNNMLALHICLSLLLIGITWTIYQCCVYCLNRPIGIISAFLFAILSFCFVSKNDLLAFHTEFALIFFSCIGIYLLLHSMNNDRVWTWVLCGMCYALAFCLNNLDSLSFLV